MKKYYLSVHQKLPKCIACVHLKEGMPSGIREYLVRVVGQASAGVNELIICKNRLVSPENESALPGRHGFCIYVYVQDFRSWN